jgi:hypothetical protein
MDGIARSLGIPGKVFCPFVDETVIIIAGSEALFNMLCVLVNGKHSRSTRSCRASHSLSY